MRYFPLLFFGMLITAHQTSSIDDGNLTSLTGGSAIEDSTTIRIPQAHLFRDYYGISMKRAVAKKCFENYSLLCLKVDLIKLVDRLNSKGSFELLPGLFLIKDANTTTESTGIPLSLASEIVRDSQNSSKKMDDLLLWKMVNLFKSFSIKIELDEKHLMKSIRDTGTDFFDFSDRSRKGRSKKGALIWSAGVLAALGFAAMAAVTGKALMASMLALMIAAFSALRGGSAANNAGYKTAHYEIITKPLHYAAQPSFTGPAHYYDHDHVQGLHSSSYSPAYDYARTIAAESKSFPSAVPDTAKDKDSTNQFRPRLTEENRK